MSLASVLFLATAALQASADDPFGQIGVSTPEGAKKVVEQLLNADSASFRKVAPQLAIMLAPDFAFPLTYEKFRESFAGCSGMKVSSARAMPKMGKPQAVRITMICKRPSESKAADGAADIMADNKHALLILPGSVERVWPEKAVK